MNAALPEGRKVKFAFTTALELTGIDTSFIVCKFICLITTSIN